MASQPLPGGVSAAAVAAAMGAALAAKVARVTLARGALGKAERAVLEDSLAMAASQQAALLRLAGDDERAYRAVLEAHDLSPGTPLWRQAWQEATEVPIRVAEASALLLDRVPSLTAICRPAVRVDLQVCAWLLALGVRAGLQAAEGNLVAYGNGPEAASFRARIRALQEGKID
jgi:formiminotetrahydrofolate cyclodeaminase